MRDLDRCIIILHEIIEAVEAGKKSLPSIIFHELLYKGHPYLTFMSRSMISGIQMFGLDGSHKYFVTAINELEDLKITLASHLPK